MEGTKSTGALTGIKVIDLSRILGGPFAGQILGDHGADVIKVEPPAGDDTRSWGPPFAGDTASYFLGINRNKRAIALDLTQIEGRNVLLRLLKDADVLIENFKIGTLEKWGLGYDDILASQFPRLIHCRISGFGADGPMGALPGYDAILQAMCGIMSVNGSSASGPMRVGVPVVDMITGINAVTGILLALRARDETGKGQFVEASLFDSALSLLHPHAANYSLSHKVPQPGGNDHPNIAPYSIFQTGTRPVYLAVGNDAQFRKLCTALQANDLADDPRFKNNKDRVTNRATLTRMLEEKMATHDGAVLCDHLIRIGVPAGPVLNIAEALAHPHVQHRKMQIEIDDYKGLASPVYLSHSKPDYRLAPPEFAEHTNEILHQAGYSPDDITRLQQAGITPRKQDG